MPERSSWVLLNLEVTDLLNLLQRHVNSGKRTANVVLFQDMHKHLSVFKSEDEQHQEMNFPLALQNLAQRPIAGL